MYSQAVYFSFALSAIASYTTLHKAGRLCHNMTARRLVLINFTAMEV
ncbi:hypothetical protein [Fischerella thermalis]